MALRGASFGVCFAMATVTCCVYWCLTLSLGDVVIPQHVAASFPLALNHLLHTLPLLLVLCEPFLVPPRALCPWHAERSAMWCVGGAYLLLLLWVQCTFSHSIYPFLSWFDDGAFALFALIVAAAIHAARAALCAVRRAAARHWAKAKHLNAS